jgi:vanillate O-demethylase monooxygenase subunit
MGDPALADPAEVIDYPLESADVPRGHALLYVKGNYEMVIDNLTDLSHLAYLHRTSIGSSGDDTARAELTVDKKPNGMRFLQLLRDVAVHPSQVQWFKGNIDRWHDFEYVAPSLVVQWTASGEAGDYDKGIAKMSIRILHAATPETMDTTHYFYCYAEDSPQAYRRGIKPMGDLLHAVFQEDLRMIEHQWARIGRYDRSKLINIPSDGARIAMATVLAEKIRAEQGAGGAPTLARAS